MPKLVKVGDFEGKEIWESHELPIKTPDGRKIEEIDHGNYYLISPDAADAYRELIRAQHPPDVPSDLRKK